MNHDEQTATTAFDSGRVDHDDNKSYPLRGRGLRFVLVNELMTCHRSMTVAEMVAVLSQRGYDLGGRASKVISDALRWELRRGRVIRTGRGVYRYHQAPASTTRRIRLFASICHRWMVAKTQTESPPPTPPHRRPVFKYRGSDLAQPPWAHLGWLWTT
jgi:hypothetical protein